MGVCECVFDSSALFRKQQRVFLDRIQGKEGVSFRQAQLNPRSCVPGKMFLRRCRFSAGVNG